MRASRAYVSQYVLSLSRGVALSRRARTGCRGHISVAAPARSPPSGRLALFGRRYLRAEPIDGVVGVCTVANAHVTRGGYRACGTLSFWKAGRSGRPAPAVSWCRAGVAGERARTWRASMGPTERSPVNERAGWHDEWVEREHSRRTDAATVTAKRRRDHTLSLILGFIFAKYSEFDTKSFEGCC